MQVRDPAGACEITMLVAVLVTLAMMMGAFYLASTLFPHSAKHFVCIILIEPHNLHFTDGKTEAQKGFKNLQACTARK